MHKLSMQKADWVIIPCSNINLNPRPNPNPNPNQHFICHVLTLMDWRLISRTENTELLPPIVRERYLNFLIFLFILHFKHPNKLFNKYYSYIEAFREVESDFRFVQVFDTSCIVRTGSACSRPLKWYIDPSHIWVHTGCLQDKYIFVKIFK